MPAVCFSVKIHSRESGPEAIADASRYLAYADQTDLFGYHGKVEAVRTAEKTDVSEGLVVIVFEAPVGKEQDVRDFLSEMDQLSRVETARRVSEASRPNF